MFSGFGTIKVNSPVKAVEHLRELTPLEYAMFEVNGAPRMFIDEHIHIGEDVSFADDQWNLWIGSIEGTIYKVSIQHLGTDGNSSEEVFQKARRILVREMGEHTEHPWLSERYLWKSNEGNVILERVKKGDYFGINLDITSSIVRTKCIERTGRNSTVPPVVLVLEGAIVTLQETASRMIFQKYCHEYGFDSAKLKTAKTIRLLFAEGIGESNSPQVDEMREELEKLLDDEAISEVLQMAYGAMSMLCLQKESRYYDPELKRTWKASEYGISIPSLAELGGSVEAAISTICDFTNGLDKP